MKGLKVLAVLHWALQISNSCFSSGSLVVEKGPGRPPLTAQTGARAEASSGGASTAQQRQSTLAQLQLQVTHSFLQLQSHSAFLCLSRLNPFVFVQVDKLSNQHLRHAPAPAAPSNYWSWSQNTRFGAPLGPPPQSRPIHGGSSPSQAPPGLSISGRRYGGLRGATRSPTSTMLQNHPYQAGQVYIKALLLFFKL